MGHTCHSVLPKAQRSAWKRRWGDCQSQRWSTPSRKQYFPDTTWHMHAELAEIVTAYKKPWHAWARQNPSTELGERGTNPMDDWRTIGIYSCWRGGGGEEGIFVNDVTTHQGRPIPKTQNGLDGGKKKKSWGWVKMHTRDKMVEMGEADGSDYVLSMLYKSLRELVHMLFQKW